MFRFAHPYYFYLFLLIPAFAAAFLWFFLWRKKAFHRFGDPGVIRQLFPEASSLKLLAKFALLMVPVAFLVLALAGPQTGSRIEKVHRKGIDLMICLDVSNSMLAEDLKPNRLERAKQSVSRLIDQLEGDRIGIIVFAGEAFVQLPITTDYAAAKLFLSTITTDLVPVQGTAIGDAIAMAVKSFGESKNNKAIVIITDGEDFQGNVLEQAESAAKAGIRIYTIGIGQPEGAPIPNYVNHVMIGYKKDASGNLVITKLDETLLQRVASIGQGVYIRASSSETGLKPVLDDLSKIQESEIDAKQFTDYESRFQYFLGIALFFLVLDLFIFEKKTQWMKGIKPF